MGDVTREDLREAMDHVQNGVRRDLEPLRDEMRRGFAGVHQRQDLTNGRIRTAEEQIARHDERLKNVSKEVFTRRSTDRRSEASGDRTPITRREVTICVATTGVVFVILRLLAAGGFKVIP